MATRALKYAISMQIGDYYLSKIPNVLPYAPLKIIDLGSEERQLPCGR